jgi:hypothetical protein
MKTCFSPVPGTDNGWRRSGSGTVERLSYANLAPPNCNIETAEFRVVRAPEYGLLGLRYSFLNFYSNSWSGLQDFEAWILDEYAFSLWETGASQAAKSRGPGETQIS